jgi:hypothetical protein
METNRKKKKKDLALFMVYFIKKGFYSSRPQGPPRALNPLPLNEAYHQHSDSVSCASYATLMTQLLIIKL